ncbi:MAG: NERD domain-containing protein, partial [Bacteroidia bacterium]|nr:NERD domain-containing protein [Bacteroidia bacterium]
MAFRAYEAGRAGHTHENAYFQELYEDLKLYYEDRDQDVVLVANPCIDGCYPDALFVKNDAVCVIDFKNYSGEFHFTTNDRWLLKPPSGTKNQPPIIKGGGKKNPFLQMDVYRKKTEQAVKRVFPRKGETIKIAGMVLFHGGKIRVTNTLPGHVSKWFHIVDKFNAVDKLVALAVDGLYLNEDEILSLLDAWGIREIYKSPSEIIEEKKEDERKKSAVGAVNAPETPTAAPAETPTAAPETPIAATQTLNGNSTGEIRPVPAAVLEAQKKLWAFVAEDKKCSFWNESAATLVENPAVAIYYPVNAPVPSEKYGYGPFDADKRPELVRFYYAVRSCVPENVEIRVISSQYVEKYCFTDATNQESVEIWFYYDKNYNFFRHKAHVQAPDSTLSRQVMDGLSSLPPPKVDNFEGFGIQQ